MAKDGCQQQWPSLIQPLTSPQACAWRGRPKDSGGGLRIKLVSQDCCVGCWDRPGLCVEISSIEYSLGLEQARFWSGSSGLAFLVWSEHGHDFYSWSLALRWKSKQWSGWLNKQPSQNQTATPLLLLLLLHCSPQPPLYHPVALNGSPSCSPGLWPCVLRPGGQIGISIKDSLRYHRHLWFVVGRLVWLKGLIMTAWQPAKTLSPFPYTLLWTHWYVPICMQGIFGKSVMP